MTDKAIIAGENALTALGSAWRNDWSGFDGRTLRGQLDEAAEVYKGSMTYEDFCDRNGIHPTDHEWLEP